MSLEQAINENTAAIKELIAKLSTGAVLAESTVGHVADAAKTTAKTTSAATAAKTTEKPADTKPAEKVAEKPTETKTEQPSVTYDDVKAAILKLATEKGRDAATAILQRHGVAKAPDLKQEQWAKVLEDTNKAIAGEYNPEEAELA